MSTLGKLAALSVVLVIAVLATGAAQSDATRDFSVTNESVTVDFSNATPVDSTDVAVSFNDSVTVYNSSDTELTNGTDYEWHPGNGSVSWFDTPNLVDGETATISYTHQAPSEGSRELGGVLSTAFRGGALLLLLFAGLAVLDWLDLVPGGA